MSRFKKLAHYTNLVPGTVITESMPLADYEPGEPDRKMIRRFNVIFRHYGGCCVYQGFSGNNGVAQHIIDTVTEFRDRLDGGCKQAFDFLDGLAGTDISALQDMPVLGGAE